MSETTATTTVKALHRYTIDGQHLIRTVIKETASFLWIEGGYVNDKTKLDKRLLRSQQRGWFWSETEALTDLATRLRRGIQSSLECIGYDISRLVDHVQLLRRVAPDSAFCLELEAALRDAGALLQQLRAEVRRWAALRDAGALVASFIGDAKSPAAEVISHLDHNNVEEQR